MSEIIWAGPADPDPVEEVAEELIALPRALIACADVTFGMQPMTLLHLWEEDWDWISISIGADAQGFSIDLDCAHVPDLIEAILLVLAMDGFGESAPIPCEVGWPDDQVPDAVCVCRGPRGISVSPESTRGLTLVWPERHVPRLLKALNAVLRR